MKKNEKGFSVFEVLVIVIILALVGAVGWLVYDRQAENNKTENITNTQTTNETSDSSNVKPEKPNEELTFKTIESIKYTQPSGWSNVVAPYEPYETGSGKYLLSPDFKEAGLGHFSIVTGAEIHFEELQSTDISSNTKIQEAVEILKNSESGYYDTASITTKTIGGKEVIAYDSGHTTDGVTILIKTASGKWLNTSFNTINGGGAEYSAKSSNHYPVFLVWVEEFITLNP